MKNVRISKGALVLVCDGGRAILLRNEGDANAINLVVVEHLADGAGRTSSLGSDRPGKIGTPSARTRRAAFDEADLHAEAERRFLSQVATNVARRCDEDKIPGIVVISPPRVLGLVRELLPEKTKQLVLAEIAKDLGKKPVASIEDYLSRLG